MKIDKNRLDKYSITATVLTSRIILSFMSAHTLIFYLRAQCVCGYSVDTLRLLLFRQTCIFARGCSGESSHASWHCKGGRISDGKNQSI